MMQGKFDKINDLLWNVGFKISHAIEDYVKSSDDADRDAALTVSRASWDVIDHYRKQNRANSDTAEANSIDIELNPPVDDIIALLWDINRDIGSGVRFSLSADYCGEYYGDIIEYFVIITAAINHYIKLARAGEN